MRDEAARKSNFGHLELAINPRRTPQRIADTIRSMKGRTAQPVARRPARP
jgi:hypothetical protein